MKADEIDQDKLFYDFVKFRSEESFNRLFSFTRNWLYKMIYRILQDNDACNDIIQFAWLKIFENLQKINPNDGKFKNFIFTVAKNEAFRVQNSRKNFKALKPGDEDVIEMPDVFINYENPEDIFIIKDRNKTVRLAVNKLSDKYRDVILLHYFAELSIAETAGTLKITEDNVKVRLNRARNELSFLLKKLKESR